MKSGSLQWTKMGLNFEFHRLSKARFSLAQHDDTPSRPPPSTTKFKCEQIFLFISLKSFSHFSPRRWKIKYKFTNNKTAAISFSKFPSPRRSVGRREVLFETSATALFFPKKGNPVKFSVRREEDILS